MQNPDEYIKGFPKAELHMHIEGSFEPGLMFEIATRNKIPLPYSTVDEVKKAYQFGNLQDFLNIYYAGARALLKEQDFYDLAMAYFQKAVADNIIHAEIMFDPQTHLHRGIAFEAVITGLKRAADDAGAKWGITTVFIMSYLRDWSEEDAFKVLEASRPFQKWITAVGLDSAEKGNPPEKFERVFRASVDAGYLPVAHAGEEGSPEYIWQALDLLKAVRIDHGVRCLEDQALTEELALRGTALTVCPLSNVCLRVVNDLSDHPLRKMLEAGLKVTVNSDDPAYFGGYLNENFIQTWRALGLGKREFEQTVKNAFSSSFIDEPLKNRYLALCEDYMIRQG